MKENKEKKSNLKLKLWATKRSRSSSVTMRANVNTHNTVQAMPIVQAYIRK